MSLDPIPASVTKPVLTNHSNPEGVEARDPLKELYQIAADINVITNRLTISVDRRTEKLNKEREDLAEISKIANITLENLDRNSANLDELGVHLQEAAILVNDTSQELKKFEETGGKIIVCVKELREQSMASKVSRAIEGATDAGGKVMNWVRPKASATQQEALPLSENIAPPSVPSTDQKENKLDGSEGKTNLSSISSKDPKESKFDGPAEKKNLYALDF